MVENSQPCLPFYFLKESKVSWPEGTLTEHIQKSHPEFHLTNKDNTSV